MEWKEKMRFYIFMHDVMSEFSDARGVSEGRVNIM